MSTKDICHSGVAVTWIEARDAGDEVNPGPDSRIV